MSDQDLLYQAPATATENVVAPASNDVNVVNAADDLESFLDDSSTSKLDADIAALEEAQALTKLTPGSQYIKRLEAADISLGDARAIVDMMCVQLKPYRKTYGVVGDVEVVFQTRTPEMQRAIDRELDRSGLQLTGGLRNLQAHLHLAHSLCKFGENRFLSKDTLEPIVEQTAAFLNKLPEPLFHILWQRLSEFENMVALALSDGFAENF